jgi:hypothetical protein
LFHTPPTIHVSLMKLLLRYDVLSSGLKTH